MPQSAGYVSAEYLREIAQRMQAIKERTYELMCLQPGQSVLDVGCGPGTDTLTLAERIGTEGRVVGLDFDEAMIAKANANAATRDSTLSGQLEHLVGDVKALPFPNDYFDACRAERLLQVLPASYEPNRVVAELGRVVRPGGRLLLADTDWHSASVDFGDLELERRLMHFFATRMRPNGSAGRQLLTYLRTAGFRDVGIETFAHPMLDFSQTPFGDWLRREATAAQVASASEMDAWAKELTERTERGSFFASVAYVVVVGVVSHGYCKRDANCSGSRRTTSSSGIDSPRKLDHLCFRGPCGSLQLHRCSNGAGRPQANDSLDAETGAASKNAATARRSASP